MFSLRMSSSLLPLVLLLSLVCTSSAQTYTSCFAQGYDLTLLTGSDLFHSSGEYGWAIRPCGVVTTPGYCTDFPGQFCQGTTTISAVNISANVVSPVQSGARWAQVQTNGQYGVAQLVQDGRSCGAFNRGGSIQYLCNPSATTPYISSITETTTCQYQAIIQTAAVCSQVPASGFSTTVGTSIISSTCGGGIYDLTQLNSQDITATNLAGYAWSIRLCGPVSVSAPCYTTANPSTSICQSGNVLATYQPTVYPVVYQYLAPGVMSQIIQDGAGCANQNRLTNVTLVCNSSATTPVLTSMVESPICHYTFTVQTSAVCGPAFPPFVPTVPTSSTSSPPPNSSASFPSVPHSSSTLPASYQSYAVIIARLVGGCGVGLVLCLAVLAWKARRTQRDTPPPLTARPSKLRRLLHSSSHDTQGSSGCGASSRADDDGRMEGVPVVYLTASSRSTDGVRLDRTSSASALDLQ